MDTALLKQEQERMQGEIDLLVEYILESKKFFMEPGSASHFHKLRKQVENLWQSKQEKTDEKAETQT